MRKIRFTEQTRSKRRNETYEKDSEHTMTDDRARLYVGRGQAEYTDAAAGKQKPDAASAASREANKTPPVRPEDYDRAVDGILKKEFDLDYCVNGMSVHYKMDPNVVRTELSSRLDAREKAAAAATSSTNKTSTTSQSSTAKAAGDSKAGDSTEKAEPQRSTTRRGTGSDSNTSGTTQDLAPKATARPAADLSTSEQSKAFTKGE